MVHQAAAEVVHVVADEDGPPEVGVSGVRGGLERLFPVSQVRFCQENASIAGQISLCGKNTLISITKYVLILTKKHVLMLLNINMYSSRHKTGTK